MKINNREALKLAEEKLFKSMGLHSLLYTDIAEK